MILTITYPDKTKSGELTAAHALVLAQKQSGKTWAELAEAAKIDPTELARAAAGKKPLSKTQIAAFGKAAGVKFTLKTIEIKPIKAVLPV